MKNIWDNCYAVCIEKDRVTYLSKKEFEANTKGFSDQSWFNEVQHEMVR